MHNILQQHLFSLITIKNILIYCYYFNFWNQIFVVHHRASREKHHNLPLSVFVPHGVPKGTPTMDLDFASLKPFSKG
jgi:hypothetical protein